MRKNFYYIFSFIIALNIATIQPAFTSGIRKIEDAILKSQSDPFREIDFILNELITPGYRNKPVERLIVGIAGPKTKHTTKAWYETQTEALINAMQAQNIEAVNLWSLIKDHSSSHELRKRLQAYDAMLSLEIRTENNLGRAKLRPNFCNQPLALNNKPIKRRTFFHIELYSRYPGEHLWKADGCSRNDEQAALNTTLTSLYKAIADKILKEKFIIPQALFIR